MPNFEAHLGYLCDKNGINVETKTKNKMKKKTTHNTRKIVWQPARFRLTGRDVLPGARVGRHFFLFFFFYDLVTIYRHFSVVLPPSLSRYRFGLAEFLNRTRGARVVNGKIKLVTVQTIYNIAARARISAVKKPMTFTYGNRLSVDKLCGL